MDSDQKIADLQKQIDSISSSRTNKNDIFPGVIAPPNLVVNPTPKPGDMFYSDGSNFAKLAPGTVGQVLTALSTGLPAWQTLSVPTVPTDGWTTDSNTLVYVSASSFKITGVDKTAQYTKGTRIKFTNNATTFYGVVYSSAFSSDTTVTLFANNDYAIANSAITNPFYSYQVSPQGYPSVFNYTPTFGGTGSLTYGSLTNSRSTFFVMGGIVFYEVDVDGTTGGSTSATLTFTVPVAMNTGYSSTFSLPTAAVEVTDSGSKAGILTWVGSSTLGVRKYDASNWGIGASRRFSVSGFYQY